MKAILPIAIHVTVAWSVRLSVCMDVCMNVACHTRAPLQKPLGGMRKRDVILQVLRNTVLDKDPRSLYTGTGDLGVGTLTTLPTAKLLWPLLLVSVIHYLSHCYSIAWDRL